MFFAVQIFRATGNRFFNTQSDTYNYFLSNNRKKEKVSKFNKLYFDFSCNLVYDYYIGVLLPVIITIAGSL